MWLIYPSPVGDLFCQLNQKSIERIDFVTTCPLPASERMMPLTESTNPAAQWLVERLRAYFLQKDLVLPASVMGKWLRPQGTFFQKRVWKACLQVPFGETISYGELGERIYGPGTGNSYARAVGHALHRNSICILIPCHRVLAQDGKLTGYAGGLDKKIALLRHEGVLPDPGLLAEKIPGDRIPS